jgi:hypothetical protein
MFIPSKEHDVHILEISKEFGTVDIKLMHRVEKYNDLQIADFSGVGKYHDEYLFSIDEEKIHIYRAIPTDSNQNLGLPEHVHSVSTPMLVNPQLIRGVKLNGSYYLIVQNTEDNYEFTRILDYGPSTTFSSGDPLQYGTMMSQHNFNNFSYDEDSNILIQYNSRNFRTNEDSNYQKNHLRLVYNFISAGFPAIHEMFLYNFEPDEIIVNLNKNYLNGILEIFIFTNKTRIYRITDKVLVGANLIDVRRLDSVYPELLDDPIIDARFIAKGQGGLVVMFQNAGIRFYNGCGSTSQDECLSNLINSKFGCGKGYFHDVAQIETCTKCDSSCEDCINGANQCISCSDKYEKTTPYLGNVVS